MSEEKKEWMMLGNVPHEVTDEFLEAMWLHEEQGKGASVRNEKVITRIMDEGFTESRESAEETLDRMVGEGVLAQEGDGVTLTEKGRTAAKNLIRRKRLAEKLLAEVFNLGPSEIRSSACRFEHILSHEVTDSVCSFLGHPPTCPHGKPIPHGDCCKKLTQHIKPLVMPLKDLAPGSRARIVFIAPKDHSRMDRLSTLGIVPGAELLLHQKKPAFVIRVGETELALDIEIAAEIYVREI